MNPRTILKFFLPLVFIAAFHTVALADEYCSPVGNTTCALPNTITAFKLPQSTEKFSSCKIWEDTGLFSMIVCLGNSASGVGVWHKIYPGTIFEYGVYDPDLLSYGIYVKSESGGVTTTAHFLSKKIRTMD